MNRILKGLLIFNFVLFALGAAFFFFKEYKEKKERAEYEASLVDTSSPTVKVLRDSIFIDYQNEKRTIHVYVPPNYAIDSSQRYPVMYFLDGESCFNDLENMAPEWEMDEVINNAAEQGKQTAIVIGINQSENRNAEYTPFINEDNPDAHGDKFTKWVCQSLKPWVDENYRTQSDASSTTIGGISRSGMMAYYMMMAHPDVFGNACIQSASMWVDYERLMAMQLSSQQLENKKIFISVGELEGGNMNEHAQDLYKKFHDLGLSDKQLRIEVIPKEGHWHMTWRKSFALFYPWLTAS